MKLSKEEINQAKVKKSPIPIEGLEVGEGLEIPEGKFNSWREKAYRINSESEESVFSIKKIDGKRYVFKLT